MPDNNRTAAIVLAGGSGRRFGSDKLMECISGVPVIIRSLRAFQECELISDIVLVSRADMLDTMRSMSEEAGITKLAAVVTGGATRAESCLAGLAVMPADTAVAAIHDGARPLVTGELIRNTVSAAMKYGAAVPAIPVKDTIKENRDGTVLGTPDRSKLAAVQTPQCFRTDIICEAMRRAAADGVTITDDASAVEYVGGTVRLVSGSEENIKITTPIDLQIAEIIMERRTEK